MSIYRLDRDPYSAWASILVMALIALIGVAAVASIFITPDPKRDPINCGSYGCTTIYDRD